MMASNIFNLGYCFIYVNVPWNCPYIYRLFKLFSIIQFPVLSYFFSTLPDNIDFGFSFYFKDGRTWEGIVEPSKTSHPINLKVHYQENDLHFVIESVNISFYHFPFFHHLSLALSLRIFLPVISIFSVGIYSHIIWKSNQKSKYIQCFQKGLFIFLCF